MGPDSPASVAIFFLTDSDEEMSTRRQVYKQPLDGIIVVSFW